VALRTSRSRSVSQADFRAGVRGGYALLAAGLLLMVGILRRYGAVRLALTFSRATGASTSSHHQLALSDRVRHLEVGFMQKRTA
jgi:uncharacterized membrane protein YphA (DoxX/SURF4 family)